MKIASVIWRDLDPLLRDRYTLRYILERGIQIAFECTRCRKLAAIDTIAMVDLYGSDMTLGELRGKARCRRCKHDNAEILFRRASSNRDFQWWPRPPAASR
jgi:hypothetical protein